MKIYTTIVFLFTALCGISQVGINTETPSVNSELQIKTSPTNPRGLLIPSLRTSIRTTTLQGKLGKADVGMLVYDTDLEGVFQWNGTDWEKLGGDDLGSHSLTKNINTGSFYISGDGDSEGIKIDDEGNVFLSEGVAVQHGPTVNTIKTSSTLGLSDTTLLTEKAIKNYVDNKTERPLAFSAESRERQDVKHTSTRTTWTTIYFEKELYNYGGGFSKETYTVSTKGLYHLNTHIELGNVKDIGRGDKKVIIGVFVNGVLRKRNVTVFPPEMSAEYISIGCSVTADLLLEKGDKVTIRVFQNTGDIQQTKKTAGEVTFGIRLVSKL